MKSKATFLLCFINIKILQIMFQAKIAYLFTFLLSTIVAAYTQHILPIKQFLAITLVLLIFDLISGIAAAIKRNEEIESWGLRRTTVKFSMYCIALLAAHQMQTVYFANFPLVFSISSFISITEFYSILENIGQVTGINILKAAKDIIKNYSGDAVSNLTQSKKNIKNEKNETTD